MWSHVKLRNALRFLKCLNWKRAHKASFHDFRSQHKQPQSSRISAFWQIVRLISWLHHKVISLVKLFIQLSRADQMRQPIEVCSVSFFKHLSFPHKILIVRSTVLVSHRVLAVSKGFARFEFMAKQLPRMMLRNLLWLPIEKYTWIVGSSNKLSNRFLAKET